MTNPKEAGQTISPIERSQTVSAETQALIEQAEQMIQHTRALVERTRKANAAFADLAVAIDTVGTSQELKSPTEERPQF